MPRLNLSISKSLIAAAQDKVSGTFRECSQAAVTAWLPLIERKLDEAGIAVDEGATSIPRPFDEPTWLALGEVEKRTGIPRVVLLRAALRLAAEHGLNVPKGKR